MALKLLHGFSPENPEDLLGNYRDVGALSRINHPRIPRHITFDVWNDTYYLVEEYCPGRSLQEVFLDATASHAVALEIVAQATEPLQYCHDRGYAHLGVKPENIVLADLSHGTVPRSAEDVNVRLLGLAQSMVLGSGKASESVESLAFMSPEQAGVLGREPGAPAVPPRHACRQTATAPLRWRWATSTATATSTWCLGTTTGSRTGST